MVSKDGDHNLSGVSLHFETPDHGTLFIQNVAVKFSSARNKSKADRVVSDIVTSRSYDQSQFLQLFVDNTNASSNQLKRRERNWKPKEIFSFRVELLNHLLVNLLITPL